MGTTYHVTVIAADLPADLPKQIQAVLDRVNSLMSTYSPDSQLSQLNDLQVGKSMVLAPELMEVLAISQGIYRDSEGAFEPTVGTLVELWGFGAAESRSLIPNESLITEAKSRIGFDKLILEGLKAHKTADIRIDLSAVAKGYAVDLVSELLISHRLSNFLVEVGGEMRLSGTKDNGKSWRIGIEKPTTGPRAIRIGVDVTDAAVATSGDYRNYFERDGVRYSHTIDPQTGYPVTHKLASVTVIADNCARADALATAFMVMGTERALALAEKLQLPVYLLVKQGDGFEARHSTYFEPYLNSSPSS
ncbi:FAD:protein FMN transferase [Porticoccus sp. W117]|uniref:FAD:protein FMN transferase n=1 Tax=Porticoccus sp. W117 TaxID=3054777 RepID=UPI0025937E36|nr:FAD:protein FMN transferase [Porticoccus sp. W117]MDM3869913.1 FAD:protein FMN transferase [Porticoccus sp. W117]